MDAAYEDKLEENIPTDLYDRKFKQWQEDMSRCKRDIRQHKKDLKVCMENEDRIWKMAANPKSLFEDCPPLQKRQLIDSIVSKCEWSDGDLEVTLRKPFDLFFQEDLKYFGWLEKLLEDDNKKASWSEPTSFFIFNCKPPTKKEIGTREEFESGRQKIIKDLKEIARRKSNDSPIHTIIPFMDKILKTAEDTEFK